MPEQFHTREDQKRAPIRSAQIGFIILAMGFVVFLFLLKMFLGGSSRIVGTWTKKISDGSHTAVGSLCFMPSGTLVVSVAGYDELARYSVAGGRLSLCNADDDVAAFSIEFPSEDEMVFREPEEGASPLFAGTWRREGARANEGQSDDEPSENHSDKGNGLCYDAPDSSLYYVPPVHPVFRTHHYNGYNHTPLHHPYSQADLSSQYHPTGISTRTPAFQGHSASFPSSVATPAFQAHSASPPSYTPPPTVRFHR